MEQDDLDDRLRRAIGDVLAREQCMTVEQVVKKRQLATWMTRVASANLSPFTGRRFVWEPRWHDGGRSL